MLVRHGINTCLILAAQGPSTEGRGMCWLDTVLTPLFDIGVVILNASD